MATLSNANDPTTIVEFDVMEETSPVITAQLKDIDGSDLALTDLDTIELTLFLTRDGDTSPAFTIVNSRDDQDVKNLNDVTISATGLLTWQVQPEDTEIINNTVTTCGKQQANNREVHRALFAFTKTVAAGGQSGKKRIDLTVFNLETVT